MTFEFLIINIPPEHCLDLCVVKTILRLSFRNSII